MLKRDRAGFSNLVFANWLDWQVPRIYGLGSAHVYVGREEKQMKTTLAGAAVYLRTV